MAGADAKKKQIEVIAITGLVLIAVFVGMTRFKKVDTDDEVFSKKKFKQQWKEVEILERDIPKEEKGIGFSADSERPPFKSPFEEKKKVETAVEEITLPSMVFQGMVWNSKRPQAIINDKVYDVNDIINTGSQEEGFNVKITEITMEGIYLRYKGRDFLVRPK